MFDISKHYQPDDTRDLLIRNTTLGKSLADCFGEHNSNSRGKKDEPDHSVVLMRGHGYTVAAPTIEQCVFRAIYTSENAAIQTASLGLRAANLGNGNAALDIQYLRNDEIAGTAAIAESAWARAWDLWVREVETATLYSRDD